MQVGPCTPETGPGAGGVIVCAGVCSPQPVSCLVGATRPPTRRCRGAWRQGSTERRGQRGGCFILIYKLFKNFFVMEKLTYAREDSKETAGDFGRQRCQPRASPPSRPSPQLHPLISRVSPHAVLPKDKPTAPWSCLLRPVPGAGSRSWVEAYGKRQNPTGTE